MKRLIQACLLKIYARAVKMGLLSHAWVREPFFKALEGYKILIEAGDVEELRTYIKPGDIVLDIGANVGFFTKRFAQWVSDDGLVMAVEPEDVNYERLLKTVKKSGRESVVKTIKGVAAEQTGTVKLEVNPIHPGDHKIGTDGLDVPAYKIDDLLLDYAGRRVCLMKIDVQGAEERVLRGAMEMIERDHPAIFIELDDAGLKRLGSSAEKVLSLLVDCGYAIHRLVPKKKPEPVTVEQVLGQCCNGKYIDVLLTVS